MISLVFLICALDGCSTISPPNLFTNEEECQATALNMILDNQKAAEKGELPPHRATFVCYNWGEPA